MLWGRQVLGILLIGTHLIFIVNLEVGTISNLQIRELRFRKVT